MSSVASMQVYSFNRGRTKTLIPVKWLSGSQYTFWWIRKQNVVAIYLDRPKGLTSFVAT